MTEQEQVQVPASVALEATPGEEWALSEVQEGGGAPSEVREGAAARERGALLAGAPGLEEGARVAALERDWAPVEAAQGAGQAEARAWAGAPERRAARVRVPEQARATAAAWEGAPARVAAQRGRV